MRWKRTARTFCRLPCTSGLHPRLLRAGRGGCGGSPTSLRRARWPATAADRQDTHSTPAVQRAPRRWSRVAVALLLVVLGVGSALVLGRWQPDAGARHGASVVTRASRAPITAAATVSKGIALTPSGGPFERMLVMRAVEPTWVRVQPDGNEPTKETLAPGSVRQWHRA